MFCKVQTRSGLSNVLVSPMHSRLTSHVPIPYTLLCQLGLPRSYNIIGLLSRREVIWDKPVQYITMWAPEMTGDLPDSLITIFQCTHACTYMHIRMHTHTTHACTHTYTSIFSCSTVIQALLHHPRVCSLVVQSALTL